ncbi:uncharacterized protein V1510DRAFT_424854 [Dipodascopsis tothii]|uniref:uncharacterized protein n=1 Tax=Dipodascopsis tothii TaxID=44089 RepID=UPI0034CF068F
MASGLDVSITAASTNPYPKPHTVYHVQARLPLRSFTVLKRYSDFRKLVDDLEADVGEAVPFKIPPKKYFSSGVNDAEFTEQRRVELERFLKEINSSPDSRWRLTAAWKDFVGLSSTGQSSSLLAASTAQTGRGPQSDAKTISDPVQWLNTLHEVKTELHQARKHISDRDQYAGSGATMPGTGVLESRSASAEAKRCLVQCASKIVLLQRGLKDTADFVGEGELRRRTDMLNIVKKERDGLESLLNAIAHKRPARGAAGDDDDDDGARAALLGGPSGIVGSMASSAKRVLGPLRETAETRPLDNHGLMDLQMRKMQDQEDTLLEFSKILARQKQIGVDINEELEIQNEMLRMLNEDVDQSDSKLARADRRLRKIK